VGKASRRSTGSDAEWAKVFKRFRAMIDLRDPDARRRAQRASRLLRQEAKDIYAAADELGRERRHDPSPAKYQAGRVARRVIKDGHLAGDVVAEYIDRWAKNRDAIAGTPEDLRAHGDDIWRLAETLGAMPKNFLEWARKARHGKRGAFPSIAMDYLLDHATEWGVTRRDLAERLVKHNVMPPPARGEDPDPDPVSRWMSLFKDAGPRARKRPSRG